MTRGSRGWRWAKAGGAVAVGTIMAVMVGGVAHADGVTGVAGAGGGATVSVIYHDKTRNVETAAVTIKIGDAVLPAYCIDFAHDLATGANYTEREWNKSGVQNLGKIKWLLLNGYPTVSAADLAGKAGAATAGLADLDKLVYAANQVAIWHFSDDMSLGYDASSTGRDGFIYKVYKYLIDAADKADDAKEPAPTLKITPATATAAAGSKAGPFTVQSAGGDVALTATGGSVVDADGKALTSVKAGGQFWLTATAPGTVKVAASGSVTVPTGRVFVHNENQKIILAGAGTAKLAAEASATFTTATPSASAAPTLPVTGASVTGLVVSGLVLLAGGVLAVVMLRRRRIRFTA